MRRITTLVLATLAAFVLPATFASLAAQAQPPAGMPRMGGGGAMPPATDSLSADRDSMTNVEMQRIAGRENVAAESVFKNIKVMKGVPAGRLLRIMNMGYSRSLGVGCNYCHVPGHWADDDKPKKQMARDMMVMTKAINDTLLPRVYNPENERRGVNCGTCHRGSAKPGGMGGPPRGAGGPGGPGGPGGGGRPEGGERH